VLLEEELDEVVLDEVVLDELALVGALVVVAVVLGALRVLDAPEPPLGAAAPPLAAPLPEPTIRVPCIPSWRWLSIGQYIR
jgi:hypothetical protein